MDIAIGQIWEYRTKPDEAWVVPDDEEGLKKDLDHADMAGEKIGAETKADNIHYPSRVVKDTNGWISVDEHTFSERAFTESKRFRLIYDPADDEGCYCTKCGDFYPYAIWRPSFKCWGCNNGY